MLNNNFKKFKLVKSIRVKSERAKLTKEAIEIQS